MENLQAIKSRLQAVQNIQKSANAMKLISSIKLAKLKKHDINSTKTTVEILKRALTSVAAEALYYDKFSPDHWIVREKSDKLIVMLSTFQGFCGSFKNSIKNLYENIINNFDISISDTSVSNTSVLDTDSSSISNNTYHEYFGQFNGTNHHFKDYISNLDYTNSKNFNLKSPYDIEEFANKLKNLIHYYINNKNVSKVYIISGKYINVLKQKPILKQILPICRDILCRDTLYQDTSYQDASHQDTSHQDAEQTEFIIERPEMYRPTRSYNSIIDLFDFVFDKYLYSVCFGIVQEHLLSELSVRVMTMDKTCRNANDMCKDLKLLYNRTRQAKITQELTEIVSSIECIQ